MHGIEIPREQAMSLLRSYELWPCSFTGAIAPAYNHCQSYGLPWVLTLMRNLGLNQENFFFFLQSQHTFKYNFGHTITFVYLIWLVNIIQNKPMQPLKESIQYNQSHLKEVYFDSRF